MRPTLVITLLVVAVCAIPGLAQKPFVSFYADLDADQVVPPSPSLATGQAELTLDLTTNRITYRVMTTCVGPIPVLQFGLAPEGTNGSILFELNQGVYDMYEGTTPALTPAQIASLYDEGMFVAISTTFPFPGTIEIRGQLRPTVRRPYEASLSGGEVVPPSGSAATGQGWFQIRQPEGTVAYDLEIAGATATTAELRQGNPGENGALIAFLSGGGDRFCGTTPALTSLELEAVLSGAAHVVVTSGAFPEGEVRGQVHAAATFNLVAEMNGAGMVPPVSTGATGLARFSFDTATRMLSYDIEVEGMQATRLELGAGSPGEATLQSARLPGGPTMWSGQLGPVSDSALELILRQGVHVRVKSVAHPKGEIRGPLVTNPYFYGFGSDSSASRLVAGHRNAHVAGSTTWTATLRGAPAGVQARLFVGSANESFRGSPIPYDIGTGIGPARSYLWMDPRNPYRFNTTTDAHGCAQVTITVPGNPGVVGYYQWVVIGTTGYGSLSVSDLMRVVIQ
jgi:hypothetical protein